MKQQTHLIGPRLAPVIGVFEHEVAQHVGANGFVRSGEHCHVLAVVVVEGVHAPCGGQHWHRPGCFWRANGLNVGQVAPSGSQVQGHGRGGELKE